MNRIATIGELHEAATARTGLTDFGEPDYREGLARLLLSYEKEAALTPFGVELARDELVGILTGRLLSEAGWRQHPEHAEVPVTRPVFVVGPTRTGTTTLHRLLTADPAHQGLETWLGFVPQPRPPRETWASNPGFLETQAGIKRFLDAHPGYAGVHNRQAGEPEECWILMRQSVTSVFFEFTVDVPSYAAWRAGVDMTDTYRRHRRNLQLIGLGEPGKRWICKHSGHMLSIDALLAVYPDALIVQTHRRPRTRVLASTCSMNRQLAAGRSTTMTDQRIGQKMLALMEESMACYRDARARHDATSFIDVAFTDLTTDPIGVVKRIYDRLGAELTDDAVTAMLRALEAENSVRDHRYELSDFGLDEQDLEGRLAALD